MIVGHEERGHESWWEKNCNPGRARSIQPSGSIEADAEGTSAGVQPVIRSI